MTLGAEGAPELNERDLTRWRLVADFQGRLARAAQGRVLDRTWTDPGRLLQHGDYLSLFLLGLLNPVVRTMRGLCAASHLERVQQEICRRPVSLASFSEAQGLADVGLLEQVFGELGQALSAGPAGPANRRTGGGCSRTAACSRRCRACTGRCGGGRARRKARCGCI